MRTSRKQKLWDVAIVEIATSIIANLVGRDMARGEGFYNAEKRRDTALARINERYTVVIVPAAKFKVGDVVDISKYS